MQNPWDSIDGLVGKVIVGYACRPDFASPMTTLPVCCAIAGFLRGYLEFRDRNIPVTLLLTSLNRFTEEGAMCLPLAYKEKD